MAATWTLGDIVFHALSDGTLRGDGGVFFGGIPKSSWRRKLAVDADNGFAMPVRPLVAEVAGRRILVETGMGVLFERGSRFARDWGIEQPVTLAGELASLGISPDDIDVVILTHLHFDHAGGNVGRAAGGGFTPAFPRARYVVQRREYGEARYPGPLSKDAYVEESLLPVEEAGLWDLLDGDAEILPGVRVEVAPGHVPALQVVHFESRGEVAVAVTDLMPSAHHVHPAWNTGYDLEPALNAATKQRFMQAAARGGWHLVFYHDPELLVGKVGADGMIEPVLRASS